MKTIGVLTSGGDAPVMNACIRAVVRYGVACGFRTVGIHRGFTGLISGDYIPLDPRSVANIIQRGGSPTARDRVLASRLGAAAVRALAEGRTGMMVGEVNNTLALTPLRETLEKKKVLDLSQLGLVGTLAE